MGTNTLTSLIPDLYQAMDTVARELTGMIPSVTLNASAERAAVNTPIRSFVAPAAASENATAAQLPPDTGAQTIGTNDLKILKSKVVPFQWTGEEQLQVAPGHGHRAIARDQVSQAIRTLVNEIEVDTYNVAFAGSSRVAGVVGTKAFNTTLGDAALVRRILVDNGCPTSDISLVIGTWEGVSLRSQATLPNLADSGAVELRNQGILLPLSGFAVRESNAVKVSTPGTTTATIDAAGYAKGATSFVLTAAACALAVGDVITFAGDTNQYTITGGTLANAGTLTIAQPGIRIAMVGAKAITVVNLATTNHNVAFHRSGIQLGLRTPAVPDEGDMADDRTVLTDPRTGISFEFAMYKQYRRVRYEVGAAWGAAVMKGDFTAKLIGLAG